LTFPTIEETSKGDGSGTSLTVSHTFTAGSNKKLIVFTGGEDGSAFTVTGVTYNGTALTKILEDIEVRNVSSAWYLDDEDFPSTPGAYNVVASYDADVNDSFTHVVGLQGAKQGAVDASASSTEGSSPTAIETDITTTTADSVILGGVSDAAGGSNLAVDTGQTLLLLSDVGGSDFYTGSEEIASAGATSMGWTAPSNQYRLVQVLLAISASAAPAAGVNTFFAHSF